MAERTVLVLSGGGALGAYQCGVYRSLARRMDADAFRSMVIVGASIGAVNGFLIAARCRDPDGGVAALERFWRGVTIPSAQFVPLPDPYCQRLNATLTGLTWGNPSVALGVPGGFMGGLFAYPYTGGFSNATLPGTIKTFAKEYQSRDQEGPRLLVRAIDVADAAPVWFDSDRESIVPSMIGASSAVPLLFKPAWHDGRPFWDGDIWHQGILAPTLNRLTRESGADRYHVVTVELFKRTAQTPVGFVGNLDHFRRMFMGARCDEEAANALGSRAELRLTRVQREPHPHERVSSSLLDWAPERIEYLLEQGDADAEIALEEK